jgi:uncharacterized protein YcfJ
MIKVILPIAIVMGLTTPILAEPVGSTSVHHVYKSEEQRTPRTKRICKEIDVPIYEQRKRQTRGSDVLGGAIIGGLLGKGLTGQDNGAAFGALAGGMFAADANRTENVIVGYRKEQGDCTNETYYTYNTHRVYSHSVMSFTLDGVQYKLDFER